MRAYSTVVSTTVAPSMFLRTEAMAFLQDALRVYISEVARVWPLLATSRQKNGSFFDYLYETRGDSGGETMTTTPVLSCHSW